MGMTQEDRRRLKGNGRTTEPLALPIQEAQRISGLSRSEIYRRLAAGDIRAVKNRGRTLVLMDSLSAYLASLQPATFRAPKQAA